MTDHFIEQARAALNPYRLTRDPLTELRNSLVNKGKDHRGGSAQVEFLDAVADDRFLKYLQTQDVEVDIEQLKDAPLNSVLPVRLQEAEFVRPPMATAMDMRRCYLDLSHQAASSVEVWNAITLCNIQASRIEASFLAASNSMETGYARIHVALKGLDPKNFLGQNRSVTAEETAKRKQAVDDCVRTVFRSMGGLQSIRGHTSVINDCNLSRVWWMGRLVDEACRDQKMALNEEQAWSAINPYWAQIAEYVIRRLTILTKPTLTTGLIAHLTTFPISTAGEMEDLLRRIGQEFSTVDLHAWTAAEVRDHLREMRKAAA